MSDETDLASRQLVREARADKADLKSGVGESSVPVGDEEFPTSYTGPPMGDVKTIYENAKAVREAETTSELDEHPGMQKLVALMEREQAEADPDIEATPAAENPPFEALPAVTEQPVIVESPGIDPETRVMIKVNGQQMSVTQGDIDAAGGEDLYSKSLAADHQFREAAHLKRQAEQRIAAAEQAEASLKVAQTTPAPSVGEPHLPVKPDAGGDHDATKTAEERAKAYNKALFDGDQEKADALLVEAFKAQESAPAPVVEPVRLPEAPVVPVHVGPPPAALHFGDRVVSDREKNEVDALMSGQYADVVENPDGRAIAQRHFADLMADPANRDRRAPDIARSAAQFAQKQVIKATDPLAGRRALKESIPAEPSASSTRHALPAKPATRTGTDIINDMRKARGQPAL